MYVILLDYSYLPKNWVGGKKIIKINKYVGFYLMLSIAK